MADANDEASWLVRADRLSEAGHPLGEWLMLTLKYEDQPMPEAKKRRQRKLLREWQARCGRPVSVWAWHRTALTLTFKATKDVLALADELRGLEMPLSIQVEVGKYDAADRCFFDAEFARLASMRWSMTVTNINHSPGMDEDTSYSTHLEVWRVSDRSLLFTRILDGNRSRLEFRGDVLYAIDGDRAEAVERVTA